MIVDYYEDSLEEVIESETLTQKLTSENIKIIRNLTWFTLILTLILFLHIYRSIYLPIRYLKADTLQFGRDFSGYQPIQNKNSNDELADLNNYLNETIKELQAKIVSKSYLSNIINSINQSLIGLNQKKEIKTINLNKIQLLNYS